MGTVSLFPNSSFAVDRVVELRIVIVEVPMWDVDSLDTASRLFRGLCREKFSMLFRRFGARNNVNNNKNSQHLTMLGVPLNTQLTLRSKSNVEVL